MKRIAKDDWDQVHEFAVDIANARLRDDQVIADSHTEALKSFLTELETKYGVCSRITATMADYAEGEMQLPLYREALSQAKAEGDHENELIILESIAAMDS